MDTLMDRILQNRYIQHFGWNSAFKPSDMAAILDVDHYTSILEDKDDTKSFFDRTTAKAVAGLGACYFSHLLCIVLPL